MRQIRDCHVLITTPDKVALDLNSVLKRDVMRLVRVGNRRHAIAVPHGFRQSMRRDRPPRPRTAGLARLALLDLEAAVLQGLESFILELRGKTAFADPGMMTNA